MQLGEAYRTLCSVLTFLSRHHGTDPGLLEIVGRGQAACAAIGEHLRLPPPDSAEVVPYRVVLEKVEAEGSARCPQSGADGARLPAAVSSPQRGSSNVVDGAYSAAVKHANAGAKASSPADVAHALALLESMILDFDEAPDAAEEYVEGIKPVVLDMRERIGRFNKVTDKQLSYIENMKRGLDKWFKDRREEMSRDF